MYLRDPISEYQVMDEKQARDALYMAVRINLDCLPQLKGAGKVIGAEVRDRAAQRLADEIFKHMVSSNVILKRGQPLQVAQSTYKEPKP